MLPRPRFDWRDEGVRRVLPRDGPGGARRVGGADFGADQHPARGLARRRADLVDHLRRSPDGISQPRCWASRWATILLPSLAKHHADANPASISSLLDWGLRLAFLLALPAAVALWAARRCRWSRRCTSTAGSRSRTSADARRAAGLQRRAAGAHPGEDPGARASTRGRSCARRSRSRSSRCWSRRRSPDPDVPLGHAGLTLSTSIGACLNAALLFWFLRKRGIYVPSPGWLRFLGEARRRAVRAGRGAVVDRRAGVVLAGGGAVGEGGATRGGHRGAGAVAYFARAVALGFRLDATAVATARGRRDGLSQSRRVAASLRCGQRGFTHSAYR